MVGATEIAHALMDSVDHGREHDDDMTDAERAELDTAIDTAIDEYDAGLTIPLETALASLRSRGASRAPR